MTSNQNDQFFFAEPKPRVCMYNRYVVTIFDRVRFLSCHIWAKEQSLLLLCDDMEITEQLEGYSVSSKLNVTSSPFTEQKNNHAITWWIKLFRSHSNYSRSQKPNIFLVIIKKYHSLEHISSLHLRFYISLLIM